MYLESTFKPAWWLTNCHLQTLAAKWFRRKLRVSTIEEVLTTPDDDIIELAWTELPCSKTIKPIVVILHGLEGSFDSHYAKGMLSAVKAQGWIGVVIHFRGCGKLPNRKAFSYHSGFTADIEFVAQRLHIFYPHHPKYAIGFSLGGNVLAQHLATQKENAVFNAATIICAPLHLATCSDRINRGFSKIYQKYLVDMLKTSALEKIERGLVSHVSQRDIHDIRTMREFDERFTAPINQYVDADDYYQRASGLFNINKVTIPTLIIHAKDDPFLAHEHIVSQKQLNKNIQFEVSTKGGHVGFITGKLPLKPEFWLEHRTVSYLSEYL
ncbi:hydrolase [Thalassotalea fusca]